MTKKQAFIKENPEMCHRCFKVPSVKGKSECIPCNAINRANNIRIRRALKEQGLCRDCRVVSVSGKELRCPRCLRLTRILAHGLTEEIYNAQMLKQDNKCAVCRKAFVDGGKHVEAPCIDHDHSKGCKSHSKEVACKICFRAILHHGCNKALGILGDDPDLVIERMNNLKKLSRIYAVQSCGVLRNP